MPIFYTFITSIVDWVTDGGTARPGAAQRWLFQSDTKSGRAVSSFHSTFNLTTHVLNFTWTRLLTSSFTLTLQLCFFFHFTQLLLAASRSCITSNKVANTNKVFKVKFASLSAHSHAHTDYSSVQPLNVQMNGWKWGKSKENFSQKEKQRWKFFDWWGSVADMPPILQEHNRLMLSF